MFIGNGFSEGIRIIRGAQKYRAPIIYTIVYWAISFKTLYQEW